jgi:hypothetical protein
VKPLVTSGLSSLSAYFVATSLQALTKDDALALVLPSSWAEAAYCSGIRQFLWKQAQRRTEIYTFPVDQMVFTDAMVSATILVVGPDVGRNQPMTVTRAFTNDDEVVMIDSVDVLRTDVPPRTFARVLWPETECQPDTATRYIRLSEFASIRRGVATGANSFFFITDKQRSELPAEAMVPGITRISHVVGENLNTEEHNRLGALGARRWLLSLHEITGSCDDRLRELIRTGEKQGLHHRYLTSGRHPWYVLEVVKPPDVIVAAMGRERFRAVLNSVGAAPSNAMHGIYLGGNIGLARKLTNWLNSAAGQMSMRREAKHYAGGLLKLEPGSLMRIEVPTILLEESRKSGEA